MPRRKKNVTNSNEMMPMGHGNDHEKIKQSLVVKEDCNSATGECTLRKARYGAKYHQKVGNTSETDKLTVKTKWT